MKVILLFLIPLGCFAEVNLEVCKREAEHYGRQNKISKTCEKMVRKSAKLKIKGEQVEILAFKNMILIDYKLDKKLKRYKIAGDRTLLKEITSITLSEDEKHLYIFDHSKLLTFKTMTDGNSAPSQVLELKSQNCHELSVKNSRFMAICEDGISYGMLSGDSRHRLISKKPNMIYHKKFENINLGNHIQGKIYDEKYLILDKEQYQLVLFDTDLKNELWRIDLKEQGFGRQPASLKVDQNEIIVKDIQGKEIRFQ